jgi:hypothetical protein
MTGNLKAFNKKFRLEEEWERWETNFFLLVSSAWNVNILMMKLTKVNWMKVNNTVKEQIDKYFKSVTKKIRTLISSTKLTIYPTSLTKCLK